MYKGVSAPPPLDRWALFDWFHARDDSVGGDVGGRGPRLRRRRAPRPRGGPRSTCCGRPTSGRCCTPPTGSTRREPTGLAASAPGSWAARAPPRSPSSRPPSWGADRPLAVRRGPADRRRPGPAPPAHPQLWARVQAGEVRASYARHVAAKTRDLSREEAAYVDAAVAESADGRIPWSRFEALVDAKVAQAAPEPARGGGARREGAVREEAPHRGARDGVVPGPRRRRRPSTRSTPPSPPSSRPARCPTPTDEPPGPGRPLLASPAPPPRLDRRGPLPDVQLYVHIYAGPDGEGIARLEGHGPVTEEWVRRVLGPHARSRSGRCSTWPARRRSMPTRSPTDIGRPCI